MDRNVKGDLRGRVAFVTGSGRNIGRAIVLELASRGCSVVINGSSDREACERTAEEARARGVEAQVAMGDVGREDEIRRLVGEIESRWGGVDILVNNAAFRPHKPFLENTVDDWNRVLAIDLTASFHMAQAFLPRMVARGWGRIIGLTGMKAIQGYVEGAPISAAKHGVWGLTKALAREFGPHGITVNAVSPGPIRSDEESGVVPNSAVPVGRKGDPADIAALIGFLASDAGRFITGQMIAANGGATT